MKKIALDEAAKAYWKLLFGEYGEQLTRDVPRRIKAALFEKKKVASINESALIVPIGHAKVGTNTIVEGMYTDNATRLMFRADLDSEGEVVDIKYFDLR